MHREMSKHFIWQKKWFLSCVTISKIRYIRSCLVWIFRALNNKSKKRRWFTRLHFSFCIYAAHTHTITTTTTERAKKNRQQHSLDLIKDQSIIHSQKIFVARPYQRFEIINSNTQFSCDDNKTYDWIMSAYFSFGLK